MVAGWFIKVITLWVCQFNISSMSNSNIDRKIHIVIVN